MPPISELPWKHSEPERRLGKGEQLIDAFGTHWVKFVAPSCIYAIVGGFAIAILWFSESIMPSEILTNAGLLTGSIILMIVHHWFFHRILSEGMVDIIITNRRVIFLEDSLWFSDNMHEVALNRIRAVEARKIGFSCNLFRYGSLWFDTGGSDISTSVINRVPHPHRVAKIITSLLLMQQ